jgi:hypothetical protein
VQARAIESDGQEVTFARATLRMWQPSPRVFVCSMTGHMPDETMVPLLAAWNRVILDPGRALIFADCWAITGYDPACRVETVRFLRAHRARIESFHILIGSKLGAMGVAVANLALDGMLEQHSDRARFALELDAVTGPSLRSSQVLSRV